MSHGKLSKRRYKLKTEVVKKVYSKIGNTYAMQLFSYAENTFYMQNEKAFYDYEVGDIITFEANKTSRRRGFQSLYYFRSAECIEDIKLVGKNASPFIRFDKTQHKFGLLKGKSPHVSRIPSNHSLNRKRIF